MKSQMLTKAQIAGIISNELKENTIWLQSFLLSSIVFGLINIFYSPITQILNLIIVLLQFVIVYAIYNSNKVKISKFKETYEGEF